MQLDGALEAVAATLRQRGQTLAAVEASAGGRLSALLTAQAGASAWFLGAAVVYSATAKEELLGVPGPDLAASGAVAPAAALLLARAVQQRLGSTWAVAETGIAGPQTGRRSRKPVGLCFVSVVGPGVERVKEVRTGSADRTANQEHFALASVILLAQVIAP